MSGITPAGPVIDSVEDVKTAWDNGFKGIFGQSIGSNPDGSVPAATSIGQEIALATDVEVFFWQLFLAVYAAFDPDQADSPQLEIVCALTGTRRKLATFSTVRETIFGTPGTTVPAGSAMTVDVTGARFLQQEAATLGVAPSAWQTNHAYNVDDWVTNAGSIWQCTVAGTSANAGPGPLGLPPAFATDNTVTWRCIVNSTSYGLAIVGYQAEDSGPVGCAAGALETIATPVNGWKGGVNPLVGSVGSTLETPPALRARRVLELQAPEGGTPDSIRAAILAVTEVTGCWVFVNKGDLVDANGVPAHGVEVLIQAPTVSPTSDDDLALLVWKAVGAGDAMGGGITKTVTDDSGNPQSVSFSRPTDVPIWTSLQVTYDPAKWPGGAAAVSAAVKAAIMNLNPQIAVGQDIRAALVAAAVMGGAYQLDDTNTPVVPAAPGSPTMTGILLVTNGAGTDGTMPYIGTAPGPASSTTIATTARQQASFATAHMTITANPGTP